MARIDEIDKSLDASSKNSGLMYSKEYRDHVKQKEREEHEEFNRKFLEQSIARSREAEKQEKEKVIQEKERIEREKESVLSAKRANKISLLAVIISIIALLIQIFKG